MTENEGSLLTPKVPETGSGLAVPKKDTSIMGMLQSDSMKSQFKMALPNTITPERFLRIAITAIRKTPKLSECNTPSLLGALMLSAQLGLEPNTPLGHAYLIPYGKECQFIIGYQGLLDLVYRSGIVKSLMVFDRCKNDDFDMQWGTHQDIKHVPNDGDRGDVLGYYAVATMQDGLPIFCYMSISDIEKHRKQYSKDGGNYSPWKTAYPEMCKKTVIRRLVKMLPKAT